MKPFPPLYVFEKRKRLETKFRLLGVNEASQPNTIHHLTTAYYNSLYLTSVFIQLYITVLLRW